MNQIKLITITIFGLLIISGLIFLSLRFGQIPETTPSTAQLDLQPSGGFSQLLAQESQLSQQPVIRQQEIAQAIGGPLPTISPLIPQVSAFTLPVPDQTQLKQQLQKAQAAYLATLVQCHSDFIQDNPDHLNQDQISQTCLDRASQAYQQTLNP